jgi:hypothetical protein
MPLPYRLPCPASTLLGFAEAVLPWQPASPRIFCLGVISSCPHLFPIFLSRIFQNPGVPHRAKFQSRLTTKPPNSRFVHPKLLPKVSQSACRTRSTYINVQKRRSRPTSSPPETRCEPMRSAIDHGFPRHSPRSPSEQRRWLSLQRGRRSL